MSNTTKKNKSGSAAVVIPAVTFNVEALQALGVDTKISKADLMEYITAQIEDNLTFQNNRIKARREQIMAEHNNRADKAKDEYIAKILQNATVKAYVSALSNLDVAQQAFNENHAVYSEQQYASNMINSYCTDHIHMKNYYYDGRSEHVYEQGICFSSGKTCHFEVSKLGKRFFQETVSLYSDKEWNSLCEEVEQMNNEQKEIVTGLANLKNHAKAARMAMLKSILGGTAEGQNLLSFLDSRARNYKALAAVK